MYRLALRMLFGDPVKCLGLVFGVGFATLLICQQAGLFVGLMSLTSNVVLDAQEADVWVMDVGVEGLMGARPMRDTELLRVRGVPGVRWAVPLFKGQAVARTAAGLVKTADVIGVDDVSLVGLPRRVVLGDVLALTRPDAVGVDVDFYTKLFPGQPPELGREVQINDRRAVIAVILSATPGLGSTPGFYARYGHAMAYTNNGRNQLSFVLARVEDGRDPAAVARAIQRQTGLKARTRAQFVGDTVRFAIRNTGIIINFGTTIVLGVIVGVAIVGLTFNLFVAENLKQYAALKAIGLRNGRLARMVLLQAGTVGGIGFSLGLALAALFFRVGSTLKAEFRGFWLPWQVAAGAAVLVVLILLVSTFVSLRRVLFVDPATVFRG